MRFDLYAGASSLLAAGAVIRACFERPNFYSSTVYIGQSNACLFILTNLALLVTYSVVLGMQKVFYGPLRPVEIEQLWEKAWFALTETALAMTIFRDEVGGSFLFMFTFLLISKVWNWLAEGRVEILEQQPRANPRLFHIRLSAALSLSVLFNIYMLRFCTGTVLQQARPNMMVMFAFEFAVLTILSLSTMARYGLSIFESAVVERQVAQGRERLRRRTEEHLSEEAINNAEIDAAGWEEKGLWTFYLDIATDFLKLVLYLTFFCVLCMFYGMPIHIIRDVALTIRSFYKRIRDFVQYKHATRNMNARYPDATAEEISREDVCIICRENMTVWQDPSTQQDAGPTRPNHQPTDERQRAKKLPCGHLLHLSCLRSWLERQQICPTCRTPVLTIDTGERIPNRQAPAPLEQADPGLVNPPAEGPHVYTFGPFRLVFGARHVQNNPLPNARINGGTENASAPILNRTQITLNPRSTSVQALLEQIEQHIARELSNINLLSDQLHVVRALQSELARLRSAQNSSDAFAPSPSSQERHLSRLPSQHTIHAYRQVPLFSRQQEFPAGLTLPDNWTLHALQRIPESANTAMRSRTSPEDVSQQIQSSTSLAPDVNSSSIFDTPGGSVQTGVTADTETPHQVHGRAASTSEQRGSPDQVASSVEAANGSSTSMPEWGSVGIQGGESEEQPVRESSRSNIPRIKGQGKAATVEDVTDDAIE